MSGAAAVAQVMREAPGKTRIAVSVRHVTKSFGGPAAVEGASFDLKTGSFLTILGPSGSGKTTLRAFAARRIRAFIVRTSSAEYFAALLGWWMYAQAALMRPGVSMGYLLFTGSANVTLPYLRRPSLGLASLRR